MNEIFRDDVTYDNIKSHKKSGASRFLWKAHFKKNQRKGGGGLKLNPPLLPPFPLSLNQ